VGPFRGRKKKLIIAFHFLSGSQAGWECEACRRGGLAERRRCRFGGFASHESRPVWVAGNAVAYQCPKSIIGSDEVYAVEEFRAWKMAGMPDFRLLPARLADALMVLETEYRSETRHE
jgi:hypothetical protein